MRIVDQRRMAVNRGATQATIERNTLPHKYKKVCIHFFIVYIFDVIILLKHSY